MLSLIVLLLAGAPDAGASAPPRPAALKCKGERAKDPKTRELRQFSERTDFFIFAVQQLGAPVSCEVKWQRYEGQSFGMVKYRLERGSVSFEHSPPETSVSSIEADGGFPDEAAARAFLKRADPVKGFQINWSEKPEVSEEKGQKTETYWSGDDGSNAGADLVTRDGKLVAVRFHMAL